MKVFDFPIKKVKKEKKIFLRDKKNYTPTTSNQGKIKISLYKTKKQNLLFFISNY